MVEVFDTFRMGNKRHFSISACYPERKSVFLKRIFVLNIEKHFRKPVFRPLVTCMLYKTDCSNKNLFLKPQYFIGFPYGVIHMVK